MVVCLLEQKVGNMAK